MMRELLDRTLEKSIERAILVRLKVLKEGEWLATSQLLLDLYDDGALPRFDPKRTTLFYSIVSSLVDRKKISRRVRDVDDEEEVKLFSSDDVKFSLAA
jgi:hypothetical protein